MLDAILDQNGMAVYLTLFALLMAGTIGLPIPEDIPLLLGGIAAQRGRGDLYIILAVCYAATVTGDMIIFSIGRRFGTALSKRPWFYGRVSEDKIEGIKKSLEQRRLIMILLARHLFYLRTMTFLTCGAVKMSWLRFLAADAFAALISVPLMVGLGFAFAEHKDKLFAGISAAKEWMLAAGLIALIAAGLYYWRKRRASAQLR